MWYSKMQYSIDQQARPTLLKLCDILRSVITEFSTVHTCSRLYCHSEYTNSILLTPPQWKLKDVSTECILHLTIRSLLVWLRCLIKLPIKPGLDHTAMQQEHYFQLWKNQNKLFVNKILQKMHPYPLSSMLIMLDQSYLSLGNAKRSIKRKGVATL